MINIRSSSLQDVKLNPRAFAQSLLDGTDTAGGSRGMFAYWQDVAKKILRKELNSSEAINILQNSFSRFSDTLKNKQRQSLLLDQLVRFADQCQKNKFVWKDGQHRIQWEFYPGVRLTGLTPVVIQKKVGYFSFLMVYELSNWESELRFPLFQQYLAECVLHCDIEEVTVGIYELCTNRFQFQQFDKPALAAAVDETAQLFEQVQTQYSNLKKPTHVLR